jgi:hypothetical protein
MRHSGRSLHQRIGYLTLKDIRHAVTAGYLMGKDGGGTLVRRTRHFARPYGNTVAHTARHELKPKVSPIRGSKRPVKPRLAIETVEIDTDELAIFHANASIIDKIGYAARGIDLVVSTFVSTRLCRYDFISGAFYFCLHAAYCTETVWSACVGRTPAIVSLRRLSGTGVSAGMPNSCRDRRTQKREWGRAANQIGGAEFELGTVFTQTRDFAAARCASMLCIG